jgi:hypothetical protein
MAAGLINTTSVQAVDLFSGVVIEDVSEVNSFPELEGGEYQSSELADWLFGGEMEMFSDELFGEEPLLSEAFAGEAIDQEIQKALSWNENGDFLAALQILRDIVKRTNFAEIKPQYYLAKQYILCFENGLVNANVKSEYKGNMDYHMQGVQAKMFGSELSLEEKGFYIAGMNDLKRRYRALGFDNDLVLGTDDSSASSVNTNFEILADLNVDGGTPRTNQNQTVTPDDNSGTANVTSETSSTGLLSADALGGDLARVAEINEAAALNITSASQIDEATAKKMLKGIGFLRNGWDFEKALKAMRISYYRRGEIALDQTMKERIFENWKSWKEAVTKYSNYPTISEKKNPEMYKRWIDNAAGQLTSVPEAQRIPLMRSLMTTESGRSHWKNFVPIVSWAGAIGTGQFLYATAKGQDINPYDPADNIKGIAKYLNKLIRRSGMRKGLAQYNGGTNPPTKSYTHYADGIINRMERMA